MKNGLLLSLALAGFCQLGVAWAGSGVDRTLTANPSVPAGARVSVENLVGHMTITQGASFQVTAKVVAGNIQAQALAQSMKLDVTRSGDQVTVHVDYPVGKYDSYQYVVDSSRNETCVLKVICFSGRGESSLDYQGHRVHVYRGKDEGVPLHVDVAVQVPAGVTARFVNGVGVLEASGLANPLTLDAMGGSVYARGVTGVLAANTNGGDLHVRTLKGRLDAATGGGDAYVSRATGDMQLATGGGNGQVSEVAGSLHAQTGGGDLNVTGYTSGSEVSLHTGGGDLNLGGGLAAARNLEVGTGGGDSIFEVSHLSVHLEVSSGGGDISVRLPNAANVVSGDYHYSADVGGAQGQGRIGSGGGDVTVSGSPG